jgi:hypothetical protein
MSSSDGRPPGAIAGLSSSISGSLVVVEVRWREIGAVDARREIGAVDVARRENVVVETAWRESEVAVDTVLEGGRARLVDLDGAALVFFRLGKRPVGASSVFRVFAFFKVGLRRITSVTMPETGNVLQSYLVSGSSVLGPAFRFWTSRLG